MKIPDIKDLVAPMRTAHFVRYQSGQLWYTVSGEVDGHLRCFEFPVPIDDADGGTFLSSDKAIFFMRWIRKHISFLKGATAD